MWYLVCPLCFCCHFSTLPPYICPLSIPTMLSVHSEQLHKTGFPTVHALVLLEGTMNLTGETQPLVEQLMMVKRMQVGQAEWLLSPRWGRQKDSCTSSLVECGCHLCIVVSFGLTSLVLSTRVGK